MKKTLSLVIVVISILAFSAFFTSQSYALSNASTYKMTVQSVQLKNASTGEWVTIASPNQEVDIASVGAGSVAASIASSATIPVGTYNNFKMIISETMKITGSDGGQSTASGGAVRVQGGAGAGSTETWGGSQPTATLIETVDTISGGTAGETTMSLDLDAGDADTYIEVYRNGDLGTPITITATSTVSIWFDFDTQSTVEYLTALQCQVAGFTDLGNDGLIVFYPPQRGTQCNIIVDGVTTPLPESAMRIDF